MNGGRPKLAVAAFALLFSSTALAELPKDYLVELITQSAAHGCAFFPKPCRCRLPTCLGIAHRPAPCASNCLH